MFCAKCRRQIEDDSIFCSYCGNQIEKVKKKEIYFSIIGITAAELMMFYGNLFYGLIIHIINIIGITFILIFSNLDVKIKNILQALTLLILLRMTNFGIPQFFTTSLLQYPLIYGVMFIPVYSIINSQKITPKELGIILDKNIYIYLPLAGFIGIIMGLIEYNILNPMPLFDDIKITDIVVITIIMVVFIGTIEELIFRSILQTRIEKVFGIGKGILLTGGIFGIMHMSYGLIGEIIFAGIFGMFLGFLFKKTGNLPFIISIHGIENIILFGILPQLNNLNFTIFMR